jgi:hypothetical protein
VTAAEITAALAEPFDPGEISWKPQSVKGNRALAIAYLNARAVQDRLDEVLDVTGWQDEYELLPDGSVKCSLSVLIDGRWVKKTDVGSQSEQPDGGDRMKAAFSDALKRAAVKFGIGRYLYRLPHQWCDYDATKKMFSATPQLPPWALPKPKKKVDRGTIGEQLHKRLREKDAEYATKKLCQVGALLSAVSDAGRRQGWAESIDKWDEVAVPVVAKWIKEFEARLTDSEMVKRWRGIVAEEPSLGDLNDALPNIEQLTTADQVKVRQIVKDYAANAGWTWSGVDGKYVPA